MTTIATLDEVVRVTTRRTWAMVLALIVVLGAVLAWGYLARIPSTVNLDGVLLAGSGPTLVTAPAAGTVRLALGAPGQPVARGDRLFVLDTAAGPVTVVSPATGVLVGNRAGAGTPGTPVAVGAALNAVDDTGSGLGAVLALDARRGANVPAGTAVRGGGLAGTVTAVEPYPVAADDLAARYGLQSLPGVASGRQLVRAVLVRLDAAAWPGATYTPVRLTLTVGSERPATLLLHGGA